MSMSAALNNALSGLTASSRRAQVISDNVANALTPGYARRSVTVAAHVVGGEGQGVSVKGIARATDPRATADRRRAEATGAETAALAKAEGRLLGAVGDVDDAGSLSNRAVTWESALARLADSPESPSLQEDAAAAARGLATALNAAGDEVQRVRMDADASIDRMVAEINDALASVEQLNADIEQSTIAGTGIAALDEARSREIDRISALVPVRIASRANGMIALYSPQGAILLDGRAGELGFSPTGIITADMTLGSGALSGLTLNGDPIAAGTGDGRLDGGALGAQFAIRDGAAPAAQDQLDAIARDLILRYEDPAVDATLAAGDPGIFTDGGGVFDPLDVVGLAGRIEVNAAVDPQQGGAAWRLRDGINAASQGPVGLDTLPRALMAALSDPVAAPAGAGFSGVYGFIDLVQTVAATRAQANADGESRAAFSEGRFTLLQETEAAVTGVDTDKEMSDLLLVEHAYVANARVIETVDGLLKRLLEI